MNTLNQVRHNHGEGCIKVKVSHKTQKVKIYQANEKPGPVFFTRDLRHIVASNVGKETGVTLREKGPHKPEFAYDFVPKHCFMRDKDLIE